MNKPTRILGAISVLLALGAAACSSSGTAAPAASRAATPAASTPAAVAASPAPAAASATPSASASSCGTLVKTWYLLGTGGKMEILEFHQTWTNLVKAQTIATQHATAVSVQTQGLQDAPIPPCGDPAHAWKAAMTDFINAADTVQHSQGTCTMSGEVADCHVPAGATAEAKAGFSELAIIAGEISKYTPAQP
jgi:hypothetical protein